LIRGYGEKDGKHRHEPERKREVECLRVSEAADEREDKQRGCEIFEMRAGCAADLSKECPVDADGEDYARNSVGEELLKEFIVGLLSLEVIEGGNDEAIGVQTISKQRLFERVLESDGPDESTTSKSFGISPLRVGAEVGLEYAPERGKNYPGDDSDSDPRCARERRIPDEVEAKCHDESADGAFADRS